jgi:hypothetical protein
MLNKKETTVTLYSNYIIKYSSTPLVGGDLFEHIMQFR